MNPNETPSGPSQYQRKLARQRQLELMEANASGMAPTMELDTAALVETEGGGSYLRARSNNAAAVGATMATSAGTTGERPNLMLQTGGASLFERRSGDDDNLSPAVNLMDHDTGIYKESSKSSFFGSVSSSLRSMTNFSVGSSETRPIRRESKMDPMMDASPAEPDFIGDSFVAASIKSRGSPFAACRTVFAAIFAAICNCLGAVVVLFRQGCSTIMYRTRGIASHKPNHRRRRLCLLGFAGSFVVVGAILLALRLTGHKTIQNIRHRISDSALRKENDARFNLIYDAILAKGASHRDKFLDLMSPEYHALRWVAYSDEARIEPTNPLLLQRYALAVMYYTSYIAFQVDHGNQPPVVRGKEQWEGVPTSGWTRSDYWLQKKGHCKWWGVTCEHELVTNSKGKVENVTHADMTGKIMNINLTQNGVMGTISPEIKAFESLTGLDLSGNKISGTFPWQLAKMSWLKKLYLHKNQMTGTITGEIGSMGGLEELRLSHNQFTGPIPMEINRCYSLKTLALNHNQLTGSVPAISDTLQHLYHVYLNHNKLSGHFPYSIFKAEKLKDLYLNDNLISGTIPPEIKVLRHLRHFHAENNKIGGTIPYRLFDNWNHLDEITLQNNRLEGTLPADMGSEMRLRVVRLDQNQLKGSIPLAWDQMYGLEQLHLQDNALVGPIPPVVSNMTSLKELWLNNNGLTGSIPTELGGATNLLTLYLESNHFTGRVPTELGELTKLEALRLHHNKEVKGFIKGPICELTKQPSGKLASLVADCHTGNVMSCECCTKCV